MPARALPSVFRRQENGVVGGVELDLVDRKIRELDLVRVDEIMVAVVADERCGAIRVYRQFPDLGPFA